LNDQQTPFNKIEKLIINVIAEKNPQTTDELVRVIGQKCAIQEKEILKDAGAS
jgi:hypothetical protein